MSLRGQFYRPKQSPPPRRRLLREKMLAETGKNYAPKLSHHRLPKSGDNIPLPRPKAAPANIYARDNGNQLLF